MMDGSRRPLTTMALALATVEEDDLEYHVTFPSPTPRTTMDNDDFVYVGEEEREPVVLLLGWAGSRDKYLAKYSALYEIKGCITIRYVPPAQDIFFRPGKFQRVALKLLELLSDLNLEEHPVLFHMFSNGGCIIYRYISEFVCQDATNRVQIRGCVFDSGPAITTIFGMTQASMVSVRGSRLYRLAVSIITFLYLAFLGVLEYAASFIWKQQREMFRVGLWKSLAEEPLRCPQLFLYSKADEICSYLSIQQFLEHRRKRGVPVHSIRWEDSPHVGHLVAHTEAYTQNVHNFLDECLKLDLYEEEKIGEH